MAVWPVKSNGMGVSLVALARRVEAVRDTRLVLDQVAGGGCRSWPGDYLGRMMFMSTFFPLI